MTLSDEQQQILSVATSTPSNLLISACAGGAKTTTMVEIAKALGNDGTRRIALAFGKDAADSLARKMPYWIQSCTMHSFYKSALETHLRARPKLDAHKVSKLLRVRVPNRSERDEIEDETLEAVALAKNSAQQCADGLSGLLLQDSISNLSTLDFDDLLWLSWVFGVATPRVSHVFLDEAQDTNPTQLALLERLLTSTCPTCKGKKEHLCHQGFLHCCSTCNQTGLYRTGRLIAVGDPHQSIYGFRGAAPAAMNNIATAFNTTNLQLTTTYRCSKAVVAEARKYI